MTSSSRALFTGAAFSACITVGLLLGLAATIACGPSRPTGTPMAGSAAIQPSPVKAERVPVGDEGSASAAPSASFAPATLQAPVVTPPPASATVPPKKQ